MFSFPWGVPPWDKDARGCIEHTCKMPSSECTRITLASRGMAVRVCSRQIPPPVESEEGLAIWWPAREREREREQESAFAIDKKARKQKDNEPLATDDSKNMPAPHGAMHSVSLWSVVGSRVPSAGVYRSIKHTVSSNEHSHFLLRLQQSLEPSLVVRCQEIFWLSQVNGSALF